MGGVRAAPAASASACPTCPAQPLSSCPEASEGTCVGTPPQPAAVMAPGSLGPFPTSHSGMAMRDRHGGTFTLPGPVQVQSLVGRWEDRAVVTALPPGSAASPSPPPGRLNRRPPGPTRGSQRTRGQQPSVSCGMATGRQPSRHGTTFIAEQKCPPGSLAGGPVPRRESWVRLGVQ